MFSPYSCCVIPVASLPSMGAYIGWSDQWTRVTPEKGHAKHDVLSKEGVVNGVRSRTKSYRAIAGIFKT